MNICDEEVPQINWDYTGVSQYNLGVGNVILTNDEGFCLILYLTSMSMIYYLWHGQRNHWQPQQHLCFFVCMLGHKYLWNLWELTINCFLFFYGKYSKYYICFKTCLYIIVSIKLIVFNRICLCMITKNIGENHFIHGLQNSYDCCHTVLTVAVDC